MRLTANQPLPPDFVLTNCAVGLDVGGVFVQFAMDAKGRGKNKTGSCSLSYEATEQVWTFTTSLRRGNWAQQWADYGVTNATVPAPGVTANLPVILVIGPDGFMSEESLNYTAEQGRGCTLTNSP